MTANFPAAAAACEKAISMAIAEDDDAVEAESRHLFAQILFSHGKKIEALSEIKQAIQLREKIGDAAKISVSLNSLGVILTEIGDFPAALESCFRSLRIKEELNDQKGIANTLINIGSIYQQLNNFQQEQKIYERVIQIATEINDKKLLSVSYLNLGLHYSNRSEFEKALEYLNELDTQLIELGDKLNAVNALNAQGVAFMKMDKYSRSLEKHLACLSLSEETGNINGYANSLLNIGEVKMKTGELTEAKDYIDRANELAKKNSLRVILKEGKMVLSDYYTLIGDYENALNEYRNFIELRDELLNLQTLKQLGEMHLKYDLEKKEKEAEINHLKNVELKEAFDNLNKEKMRSDKLLLNILPEEVAEELKQTGTAKAKYFELVTVMFADIKNFTVISQQLKPEELVSEIDFLFRSFDEIIQRFDIEKIKTIGDAYMCASGIPSVDLNSAEKMALAALEISAFMQRLKFDKQQAGKLFFEVRIGISSGPVVAGIVGSSKFAYDIWGDTVNTAARMEQCGEVGKINVSGTTQNLLRNKFNFIYRGKINAKNKGEVDMYFLEPKLPYEK